MDKYDKYVLFVDTMVLIGILTWYVSTTSWGQQHSSIEYDLGTTTVMIAIFAAIAHVARWMERRS
jgi:hypothetical protein